MVNAVTEKLVHRLKMKYKKIPRAAGLTVYRFELKSLSLHQKPQRMHVYAVMML